MSDLSPYLYFAVTLPGCLYLIAGVLRFNREIRERSERLRVAYGEGSHA
jgi:hypothetical protein